MKIKFSAFLLSLFSLIALFGCGGNKDIVIDASALALEISEHYNGGEIELVELSSQTLDSRYGLSGLYTYIYSCASVTVTSDEIAVIEGVDIEDAKSIYKIMDRYREERAELFASYAAEQVPKLEGSLLARAGKYVIFVASDDISAAEKIWNKYKG